MNPELLEIMSRITDEERGILEAKTIDKTIYTSHSGFTVDREKMLGDGKLIALRPHTRFIDFPKHSHNYIEIIYMCRGCTTHIVDGSRTVILRQGELLFLNIHAFHEIRNAGEADIAVNFIVLPQFFDTAYNMIDKDNILSQFIADNLCGTGSPISCLHFKVADVLPVQNIVESLIWNIVTKQSNRRNINQVTMGLLFLHLLNQTERIDLPSSTGFENKMIIAILREIEENYQHASLSGLAKQLGYSVSRLSRLVKEQTGKTFKQILQEKRFSKALVLLSSSGLSIADIAASVGYENTSYFHRVFFKSYAMTPAKYREAHRN